MERQPQESESSIGLRAGSRSTEAISAVPVHRNDRTAEQDLGLGTSTPAAAGQVEQVAVLITGMHRCGTSALARTLSLLGAALPVDVVPPNAGNPHGHWEPRAVVELNDRMLRDARTDLYGTRDIDPAWFDEPSAAAFANEAADLIARDLGGERLVVLKDPRTALLVPIWTRALEERGFRVVHILPLRHPSDVAASLRRRHLGDFPYDAWAQPRGEAVWLRYTLAAVRGSRGHRRAFLRYADLLGDWRSAVRRVGREIGVEWPGLGTAREAEVDAFLHANEKAVGEHPTVGGTEDLRTLDMSRLAAACYDRIATGADDVAFLDAVGAEYADRIGRTADLIGALENLYPLVWRFYEAGEVGRQRLDLSLVAEARLREKAQRAWTALVEANNDRLRMQLDAGSRDRQIVGLSGEVAQLEGLAAAAVERATAVEGEAARLRDECEVVEALRRRNSAAEARVAAMEASTSWRLTAPLRALARAFRSAA